MICCCLDVDYNNAAQGHCAAVLFHHWTDTEPAAVVRAVTAGIAPYQPGAFYKRELPCMLHTLQQIEENIDALVIDGYVWLGENRGGLGVHLYEALGRKTPVIGVAKSLFRGAETLAVPVWRGKSKNPLWVTTIGVDVQEASQWVEQMAGLYRLPDLIKRADTECRDWR